MKKFSERRVVSALATGARTTVFGPGASHCGVHPIPGATTGWKACPWIAWDVPKARRQRDSPGSAEALDFGPASPITPQYNPDTTARGRRGSAGRGDAPRRRKDRLSTHGRSPRLDSVSCGWPPWSCLRCGCCDVRAAPLRAISFEVDRALGPDEAAAWVRASLDGRPAMDAGSTVASLFVQAATCASSPGTSSPAAARAAARSSTSSGGTTRTSSPCRRPFPAAPPTSATRCGERGYPYGFSAPRGPADRGLCLLSRVPLRRVTRRRRLTQARSIRAAGSRSSSSSTACGSRPCTGPRKARRSRPSGMPPPAGSRAASPGRSSCWVTSTPARTAWTPRVTASGREGRSPRWAAWGWWTAGGGSTATGGSTRGSATRAALRAGRGFRIDHAFVSPVARRPA